MIKFDVLESPFRCRTKDTLRFQEMKTAIERLSQGDTMDDLRRMSVEENIFSAVSPSRAKEILNMIRRRLDKVDQAFLAFFLSESIEIQKVLCVVTVMLEDRSSYTFMDDVFKEKLIAGESVLYKDDLIAFIHKLQTRDEKAASWTDDGIRHMRDNYKSILREGGLISAAGQDRQILRPLLTEKTIIYLDGQGLSPIRKILTGER